MRACGGGVMVTVFKCFELLVVVALLVSLEGDVGGGESDDDDDSIMLCWW